MKKYLVFLTAIFVVNLFIFYLTSGGHTPYNYFTRLADAFLDGKYYLTENPAWLNELVPNPAGTPNKFLVVYPPMPAIVAIPFVAIFGERFPQEYIAHFLGAGFVVNMTLIALHIKKDKKLALWTALLTGIGNIAWFLAATGSSWYLGQVSAIFFLSLTLLLAITKRSAFWAGVFFGAAYLSRLPTVLSFPLFLYLFWDKKNLRKLVSFALGAIPFALFNFSYNFIRFGVPWDKAYVLIPGILDEPWYSEGIFSVSYFPRHLAAMFTSLPIFTNKAPYVLPTWGGIAIWITTPAFIYALLAPLREHVVKISWLAAVLVLLPAFFHGTTGFAQFGYRFAVDMYPILIFLTIKSVAKTGVKFHHWLFLAFGILVNTWGVIFINKLHLVI